MSDLLKVNVDEKDDVQQSLPVADVGELLRSKRLKKNLSQKEVASELRINTNQLDALENNQFDTFSSPVFVQGYLRNYAKLLDLDPEPILNEYRSVSQIQNPAIVPIKKVMTSAGGGSQIPLSKFTPVILALITVLVVIWLGSNLYSFIEEMGESSDVATESNSESIDVLDRFQAVQDRQESDAPVSSSSAPTQPAPRAVAAPIPETPVAASTPEPETVVAAPPEPVVTAAKVTATFHFHEDSWVEASGADGARLLTRVGKAGTSKTISGVPPLKIVLGNAPAVDVEFEGKPYKVRLRQGTQVARFRLGSAE